MIQRGNEIVYCNGCHFMSSSLRNLLNYKSNAWSWSWVQLTLIIQATDAIVEVSTHCKHWIHSFELTSDKTEYVHFSFPFLNALSFLPIAKAFEFGFFVLTLGFNFPLSFVLSLRKYNVAARRTSHHKCQSESSCHSERNSFWDSNKWCVSASANVL